MKTRQFVIVILMLASLVLPSLAGNASTEATDMLIKFEGVIQDRPDEGHVGLWVIDGQSIEVVEGTIIIEDTGPAAEGATVVVVARQQEDGVLRAVLIRVKSDSPIDRDQIHLVGYVSEVGDDYLVINGLRIALNENTEVTGGALVGGVLAAVIAQKTESGYVATNVHVVEVDEALLVQIEGLLESIGDLIWVVNGQEFRVTGDTAIIGVAVPGVHVEVTAKRAAGGVLEATRITVTTKSGWPPQESEFSGLIESHPPLLLGKWLIGGQTVYATAWTEIQGVPATGKTAHVKAVQVVDDKLFARLIAIADTSAEETQFTGTIEFFADGPRHFGVWLVGGKPVAVLPDTVIEGTPQVGAEATVTGHQGRYGLFIASHIQVQELSEPVETPEGNVHIIGYITEVGEDYIVVNNLRIAYTEETHIEGPLEVGRLATVIARSTPSGYVATDIRTYDSVPVATIAPPVTPEPSVTPEPGDPSQAELHLLGYITEVGGDYIIVNGVKIYYDENTDIQGELEVGQMAAVRARITPEGTYVAIAITVFVPNTSDLPEVSLPVEGTIHLQGVISEVGGDYIVVNATKVHYDGTTQIEGTLQVNGVVEITAESTAAGYVAESVRVTIAVPEVEDLPDLSSGIKVLPTIEGELPIPPVQPIPPGKLQEFFQWNW